MFLRDFMTQAKIKKYILYMLGFAALIKLFFQDKTIFYISDIAGSMIGLGIAFTSTAYIIYTYSTLENSIFSSVMDMYTHSKNLFCYHYNSRFWNSCSAKYYTSRNEFSSCCTY